MRNRFRKALSHVIVGLCALAVLVALVPLAFVLFYVVTQGVTSLSLSFFTEMPKPVGEPGGGMANAIVGSMIVVGIGALFAIPIGIISGIYASEYAGSRMASTVRFAADTLNGVPSIVIGVFVYGIAVLPFRQFSAIAGGVALGIMMIPLIMRTTEELLLLVPGSLKEGALALGATRARAVFTVVLPAALPGIMTGILLGAGAYRRRNSTAALHGVQQSILLHRRGPTDRDADGAGLHLCDLAVQRLAPAGMGRCAGPRRHRRRVLAARAHRHGAHGAAAARKLSRGRPRHMAARPTIRS